MLALPTLTTSVMISCSAGCSYSSGVAVDLCGFQLRTVYSHHGLHWDSKGVGMLRQGRDMIIWSFYCTLTRLYPVHCLVLFACVCVYFIVSCAVLHCDYF